MTQRILPTLMSQLAEQPVTLGADETVEAVVGFLQSRYGATLDAVILYGSYLRGERDTLLDLYVLLNSHSIVGETRLERFGRSALAPNVYYLPGEAIGNLGRAKYAVVGTEQLQRCVATDFHSYFWSRLAQPCAVLYTRTDAQRDGLLSIRAQAVNRCLVEAAKLPGIALSDANKAPLSRLWLPLFEHTYACELRSESPARAQSLLAFNQHYYESLAHSWLANTGATEPAAPKSRWRPTLRRWLGKGLSLARLCKASLTFTDGIDYLLWKVQRHSGLVFEASPRARKYPLLFAWPLVWRVWRAGGFR